MAELHETLNNYDRRLRQLETKTVVSTGGVQGIQGTTGIQGAQGDKGGIRYAFSTTTTMADPGTGTIRFNSGTFASITAIAIDDLDKNSVDVSTYILSWDDSGTSIDRGTIEIKSNVNGTAQIALFRITALTDNAGWTQLTVVPLSGSVPANAAELVISFHRTGLQGTTGSVGVTSLAGTTNEVSVSASTGAVTVSLPDEVSIARIRLTDTTDATLSSTTHAFQVGTTSSINVVIDPDEIQSRNNGVASALNINPLAGDVNIGTSASTISLFGDTGIGRTPTSTIDNTTGASLQSDGQMLSTASSAAVLILNRTTDDGNLVRFYRGSATNVADISVSSGAVTYGTFAGSHWSQIENAQDILVGTVMETVDEMCIWESEEFPNKTLAKVQISNTASSKRVYGIFLGIDSEDEYGDIRVGSLGALFVRIQGGVLVEGGDLLESDGNGCAVPQSDDIIRSSTIGKVSANVVIETYPDGSYLVPCVLYCG